MTENQDFYLEISPRRVGATGAKPTRLDKDAIGKEDGPKGDYSDGYDNGAALGGLSDQDTKCDRIYIGDQTLEGSGMAHVSLDQVKLKREGSKSSHSSRSSSAWSEKTEEIVRWLEGKLGKCIGRVRRDEPEIGRPCRDLSVVPQQHGDGAAAAPHPHGRIRNPHHTNYGGMAREVRLSEGQLGREHGSRHNYQVGNGCV